MKRLVLSVLAATAALSPTFAADLPSRMPVKAPALFAPTPVVNWGGFYAGLSGGYGWGKSTWNQSATGLSADMKPKGGLLGGQLGYNMHVQNFVLGVETDIAWSGMKGSSTGAGCATSCETKNPWLGTTRGRVGMPMGTDGAWLPYLTGGVAYGDVTVSDGGISRKSTRVGWTLGAGVEYMFAPAWSAKLEYLYVDLGKFTTIGDGTAPPFDVKYRNSIVRVGANYHF
ncbi:outer membrane protein [Pseudolabrys sp. FHR47]|uniref:outer membrane protein n=1 Tax=Pseudolabrys sp. FHR47 TaxID=2562284 RepID=UPI001FEFEC4C|nr:outer membrane protein [Pseudolabrys sp. FHR47]